jgi:hypothetical protein
MMNAGKHTPVTIPRRIAGYRVCRVTQFEERCHKRGIRIKKLNIKNNYLPIEFIPSTEIIPEFCGISIRIKCKI